MTKRKCGTCRFFDDRGLAGSGWCTQPSRREWHNLVMVRKSELACRNSWDQDLWLPRTDEALALLGTPGEIDAATAQHDVDVPSPTVDDASQQAVAARVSRNDYTDKITTIGVPLTTPEHVTRSTPMPTRSSESPSRTDIFDGVRDPRTAVRDAQRKRQEQLDANRQRFGSNDAERDKPAAPATPPPLMPVASGDDELPIVRAPRTDRSRRDIPIPPPAIDDLPANRQALPPAPPPAPQSVDLPEPAATMAPVEDRPSAPPRRQPALAGVTEQLPVADLQALLRAETAQRPAPAPAATRTNPGHVEQRASDLHDRRAPSGERMQRERPVTRRLPQANIEDWSGLESSRYTVAAPRMEAPVALEIDPVDSSVRLQSVRRCCGTCRDFRRDEDGEQGWCENSHAFAQRRMVQSSELACRSSIGVWWLPHDELWLEHADITHHGRPTPLMDGLGRELMMNKQAMDAREAELES